MIKDEENLCRPDAEREPPGVRSESERVDGGAKKVQDDQMADREQRIWDAAFGVAVYHLAYGPNHHPESILLELSQGRADYAVTVFRALRRPAPRPEAE